MSIVLESTPIDTELTNLPLPVLMTGTDFSLNGDNFHHHFHPSRSSELGYDPTTGRLYPRDDLRRMAGMAVRTSRVQDIPIWLHSRYNNIFSGPPLPETLEEQFTTVVLVCAGIVPRQAIDLYTPGEFSVVDLAPKQHDFIRRHISFEGVTSIPARTRKDG